MPQVNYWAVLVSGLAIFFLGGLWYSPLLFAKRWTALMGKTGDQMKAAAASSSIPLMYLMAFITGMLTAWVLAIVVKHFTPSTALRGAEVAAICWLGFAGATSFATALFSMQPKQLWLINSGYNLVSFVVAGIILAVWQ